MIKFTYNLGLKGEVPVDEKQNKQAGIHDGHRQRMKERLLKGDIDAYSPHEILEVLLYYAIPYRDTNGLAHALAARFGGWTQVLEAHYEDLVSVEGITPHAATLITLVGQTARRYQRDSYGVIRQLADQRALVEYIIPWFAGEKDESVLLVSLDNKCKLLNTTRIFHGSVNSAQFHVRLAVRQALRDNATQVVLAHNHPNGFAFPSEADVRTTHYVSKVLYPLDIRLMEHVVVAEGDALCLSTLDESRWIFDGSKPPAHLKVAQY